MSDRIIKGLITCIASIYAFITYFLNMTFSSPSSPIKTVKECLIESIADDIDDVLDGTTNDQLLAYASTVTLADLLEHPAACVETLSMIRNVLHYSYVFPEPENDKVERVFHEINEQLANKTFTKAFKILGDVKLARKNNVLPRKNQNHLSAVRPNFKPSVALAPKPVVIAAPILDIETAKGYVKDFVSVCKNKQEYTFTVVQFQEFVKTSHLGNNKVWNQYDSSDVSGKTFRWKQTCSTALGAVRDQTDLIHYRTKRQLWCIYAD